MGRRRSEQVEYRDDLRLETEVATADKDMNARDVAIALCFT